MNAAKAYRKLKEVEETKLSNRLMLLRLELDRSARKIDETTRRTEAIREHQAALERRAAEKLEAIKKKAEEQALAQQINQIARTRMNIIRRTKVKSVSEQKREEAAAVISARRAHYANIEAAKEEQLRRALAVKHFVRATLEQGKEARKAAALARREEARAAFQARVQSEAAKSQQAEKKVSIMEAEELRLIRLLEQTQAAQRSAYTQLESALLTSRTTLVNGADELRNSMAASLTARSSSRLSHTDLTHIAVATLPPVVRRAAGIEEEKTQDSSASSAAQPASARKKPQPPSARKPAQPRGKAAMTIAKAPAAAAPAASSQSTEESKESEGTEAPAATEAASAQPAAPTEPASSEPVAAAPAAADASAEAASSNAEPAAES